MNVNMPARIGSDIKIAADILQKGGLVGLPTETVYGLAALCTQPKAVAEVYHIKKRPLENPLILHSSSLEAARPWLSALSQDMEHLAAHFWPGPLTLLLPKAAHLDPQITAGLPRVALRIPAHPVAQALLQRLKVPVAAPSANLSGYLSPTCSAHVAEQLGPHIPYILEGGPSSIGLESSILGFEGKKAVLYRPGAVPKETLEQTLGTSLQQPQSSVWQAPGMQARHYAPRIPLHVGPTEKLLRQHRSENVGLLRFSKLYNALPTERQRLLSPSGDLQTAAARLFSALHELEKMKISCILAEPLPNTGLGRAINDRLCRAAASYTPPH